MSQHELSEAVGVISRGTLGNIETGAQGVRLSVAVAIAAELGVPMSTLLGERGCAACDGFHH